MVPPPPVDPDPRVGEHLAGPLFKWCLQGNISVAGSRFGGFTEISEVGEASELSERGARMCVALRVAASRVGDLRGAVSSQPNVLIDMIDWLVREHASTTHSAHGYGIEPSALQDVRAWFARLEHLLESGGSAWTVDLDLPGLVQRVSAAERDDFDRATAVDDPAAEYLREAWAAAWGVSPDGELAYDKAIKALEAMFRPVVAPKNAGATLGQIVGDLDAKPEKWSVRMDDARPADHRETAAECGCVPDRECGWFHLRGQSQARRGGDSCCQQPRRWARCSDARGGADCDSAAGIRDAQVTLGRARALQIG